MAVFVLYLPTGFSLRCRMVEFCPKPKNEFPAGDVERNRPMDGKEAASNQPSASSQNPQQRQDIFTPQQRAEALVRRIGETCDELDKLAEQNPGLVGSVTRSAEEHKDAYLRLKARLALANMAPRCRWVKQGGTACGSPQMKKHIYCFAHMQMAEARTLLLLLPPPEDANAIQVGLMRIQKAMIEDTISTKKAGLLLYSMQLALTNVGQTTFGQAKEDEMVRDTVYEEEAISEEARNNQHPAFSERQGQKPLPTEPLHGAGAENAKGNTEKPSRTGPVRWKPTPDMYRMNTSEGREAYEASFSDQNHAATRGPARAVSPVIAPDDRAETHAVLG
jgi:hypothetical protein